MKYYVASHDIKVVIAGPHIECAKDAAMEAMLGYSKVGTTVANLIIVSERGFDYDRHDDTEDEIFDTEYILKEAGFTFGEDVDECQ